MSLTIQEFAEGSIFEIKARDWLQHSDYLEAIPEIGRMIQRHGKISLIFHMERFEGWEPAALVDDIRFDIEHFKDIDRLAIVGIPTARRILTDFHKRVSGTQVRYFDDDEIEKARAWVSERR